MDDLSAEIYTHDVQITKHERKYTKGIASTYNILPLCNSCSEFYELNNLPLHSSSVFGMPSSTLVVWQSKHTGKLQ
jgi:hypothetical protein